MNLTRKKDFVEIKFLGRANGKVFDTNIEEEIKKTNSDLEAKKTIVCIGERMVIDGLDNALEGKEIDKKYEIKLSPKEAFGKRNTKLIKTIPLSVFIQQKINPKAGETLILDNNVAKIIAVSGARVITDFNNPLAGKEIEYEFTITKVINDEKEKAEALLNFFLGFTPKVEISEKILVRNNKNLAPIIENLKVKFKEIMEKDIEFRQETETKPKPEKVAKTN